MMFISQPRKELILLLAFDYSYTLAYIRNVVSSDNCLENHILYAQNLTLGEDENFFIPLIHLNHCVGSAKNNAPCSLV